MPKKKKSIPIRIRLFVIKRDNCTCQYCGKKGIPIFRFGKPCVVENPNKVNIENRKWYNGKDIIPFHFDHVIPRELGGTNDINNIVVACRKCNLSKSYKEVKQWLVEG